MEAPVAFAWLCLNATFTALNVVSKHFPELHDPAKDQTQGSMGGTHFRPAARKLMTA